MIERIYASQGITRIDFTTNKISISTPLLHQGILKKPIYFDFGIARLLLTSWLALLSFRGIYEPGPDYFAGFQPPKEAVEVWKSKIRFVGVEGPVFEKDDQDFFPQCPELKTLVIEEPYANRGTYDHGLSQERMEIGGRVYGAWREQLRRTDEGRQEKVPFMDFFTQGSVDRTLTRF